MEQKIYIVGIGMDGDKTLTKEAEEAIASSELLIGAKRMLELFAGLGKEMFDCYDSEKIAEYIAVSKATRIAVLMSGDCGFYSGANRLLPLLEGRQCQVMSGISSPVYFCAKIGKPWQDVRFVSLHGVRANVVRHVAENEYTFFLLGGEMSPAKVCERLCEYDLGEVKVYIGVNLALEEEQIFKGMAREFLELETGKLAVMLVEHSDYERNRRFGIGDEEFLRGKVPMTKAEVRSVVLSKLDVKKEEICWDIGSGSGSVSVEMALQCPYGMVYAVEKKEEAYELSEKNKHKFRCDNIALHLGDAMDCIQNFPIPDCVFVGGCGGQLSGVLACAFEKNSHVRIVVTAVSLETLRAAVEELERLGRKAQVVQVAVTRTRKVGAYTMFDAQNPIFVITG